VESAGRCQFRWSQRIITGFQDATKWEVWRTYRQLNAGVYYVHQHRLSGNCVWMCNHLQFKCEFEQNKFWNATLASGVNLWKYVEIVQHNMESQKSALLHFRPKVAIEHSNTQTTISMQHFCQFLFWHAFGWSQSEEIVWNASHTVFIKFVTGV
jgi:hypothetical protein